MISDEQMARAEQEFHDATHAAFQTARSAELDLEHYRYRTGPDWSYEAKEQKLAAFQEADYQAESRAWIAHLIREARKPQRHAIPHQALCFFKDGNQWCCVHGDFVNLQESPAGFGSTFSDAMNDLQKHGPHYHVASNDGSDSCKRCGRDLRDSVHLRVNDPRGIPAGA